MSDNRRLSDTRTWNQLLRDKRVLLQAGPDGRHHRIPLPPVPGPPRASSVQDPTKRRETKQDQTDNFVSKDPYGCLRYGDTSQFSVMQIRHLLNELQNLANIDPYFLSEDWSAQIGNGLARPELKEEIVQLRSRRCQRWHASKQGCAFKSQSRLPMSDIASWQSGKRRPQADDQRRLQRSRNAETPA